MASATPSGGSSPMDVGDTLPTGSSHSERFHSPDYSRSRDTAAAAATAGLSAVPSPSRAGALVIDPDTEPSSTLNPRSCVTCRRRKVRCDKHMPCGNCRKAHISCIFPAPGRAPRRLRPKDPNAPPKQSSEREIELMKRLRKLEGIVEDLSGQIEVEARHPSSAGASPEENIDSPQDRDRRKESAPVSASSGASAAHPQRPPEPGRFTSSSTTTSWGLPRSSTSEVNKDFGRLVLNDNGKTRYVSSTFWSKMNDELDQLRAETQRLTDEATDESEDEGSSPATVHSYKENTADHHAFVLGYRSADVDLRKLHPLPSQVPFMWQIYTENVDPLVKILHVPTMNNIIRKLRSNVDSLTPGEEALMFSIYFAAITSMEEDEVKRNFGTEKVNLIKQYQFGTEQALAKANFLNTSELLVVQAFTLFIILVRRYDDTRFSWTLTGLLIRICQSIGIHREGTNFSNLSPFDVEMRRRLWWAIIVLDLRSAEDQGTELTIADRTFDTQIPMNIHDSDITPDMKELPQERVGPTGMTFCLIRYEIVSRARRLHSATTSMAACPKDAQMTLEEREDLLNQMHERVDKYLESCSEKDGELLHWVAASVARLIMAKMSLFVYQPFLFAEANQDVSRSVRDRLFTSCIEAVEYNKLLSNDPRCKQYRWLFQTYTQWNAIAYLLLEVCRRPWSASVERAWIALDSSFRTPEPTEYTRITEHSAVLLPLRKLMAKARRRREEELTRLRADPQAAEQLDDEERNNNFPARFHHLPSSVRITLAQDRWRKLVGRPSLPPPQTHGFIGAPPPATPKAPEVEDSEAPSQPTGMSEGQIMDLLDGVMAQPSFSPVDLWPLSFQQAQSLPQSDESVYSPSMPNGNVPLQADRGFAQNSNRGSPATGPGASGLPGERAPAQARASLGQVAVPVSTAVPPEDDNQPPWLWPNLWTSGYTNTSVHPIAADDVDMNMDDDFNWQDWQQSVRGFEMNSGVGTGRTGGGFSSDI